MKTLMEVLSNLFLSQSHTVSMNGENSFIGGASLVIKLNPEEITFSRKNRR